MFVFLDCGDPDWHDNPTENIGPTQLVLPLTHEMRGALIPTWVLIQVLLMVILGDPILIQLCNFSGDWSWEMILHV